MADSLSQSFPLSSGVEAIIIAMEQVERHTEIKGELPEIKCPVICVSHETVGALGDGQVMNTCLLLPVPRMMSISFNVGSVSVSRKHAHLSAHSLAPTHTLTARLLCRR